MFSDPPGKYNFMDLDSKTRARQVCPIAFYLIFIFVFIFIFSIFLFSLAYPLPGHSGDKSSSGQKAVVTYIYDGDTFRIRFPEGERRVRLLGVDAPEIGDPSEENDLWAHLARKYAQFFLLRKAVTLSYEAEKQDSYGRLLAYVWLEGKVLFNEQLLEQGLADFFPLASLHPDMRERLQQAEEKAKHEKRGKWQPGWPTPIEDNKAKNYYGEFQAINLICRQVKVERSYTLILSRRSNFQAFIPGERRSSFSVLNLIIPGVKLTVFGLVEDYRGRPQVVLFSPAQIKII